MFKLSAVVVCLLGMSLVGGRNCHAAIIVEVDAIMASGLIDGYGPGGHMNYVVGSYTFPDLSLERRNYFVFDLSAIDKPVVSASLKLYLTGPPDIFSGTGYISPDAYEPYRISGTPFPASAFLSAFMHGADDPPSSIIEEM